MAFPTVVSVTESADISGDTSVVVTLPGSIQSGDLLIVIVNLDTNLTGVTTWGSSFNELFDNDQGTHVLAAGYKIATGSEGASVTLTCAGTADEAAAHVYQIRDWHGSQAPEHGTTATGSSANPAVPAVTASWGSADNLFIACMGASDSREITAAPTDYTNLDYITPTGSTTGSQGTVASARRNLTAASDDPDTFTINITPGTPAWSANIIVVRGTESTTGQFIGCGVGTVVIG